VLRWSYAASKAVDEFLALAYYHECRLPVVVVRCFNTCGPRQSAAYGMVIPNMIARALRNEPILVFGDGQQSRCFSAVSDVVRGVLLLADAREAEGDVFNVGTDEEISVMALAQRIRAVCHSSSPIECVPYEQVYGSSFEDMRRRVPDLSKIRRFVGYRPQASLDQLLEVTTREMCEEMGMPCPVGLATA
jgi:UDP-glucose 4-epimerase